MQVFVKRSVYNSIMKSLQDSKLEKLKAEVISILKRKEKENGGDAELKKAIAYFSKDEAHYSYLEKSVSGEWIEKAGYGVGTVRIWKGKKYKKVSSSPVRWVRVFDKHDRGAATSMGKYIAQVKKCNSVEELYQFCMKQRSLFQDDNGVDLPIMDKLKAAIDEQSGKLEGSKAEKNTAEENYIKNSGNKKLKDKVKAAIKKYGVTGQNLMNVLYSKDKELYNELDKMGADNAKQFIMQTNADNRDSKVDKKESEKKDKNNWIGQDNDEFIERYKEIQRNPKNIYNEEKKLSKDEFKNGGSKLPSQWEHMGINKMEKLLIESPLLKKFNHEKNHFILDVKVMNDDVLLDFLKKSEKEVNKNGETNAFKLELEIKNDLKDTIYEKDERMYANEFYNRIMPYFACKENYDNAVSEVRHRVEILSWDGALALANKLKTKGLLNVIKDTDVYKQLKATEKKEESEQEKHQNRSDAMKGNQNAYKGGSKENLQNQLVKISEEKQKNLKKLKDLHDEMNKLKESKALSKNKVKIIKIEKNGYVRQENDSDLDLVQNFKERVKQLNYPIVFDDYGNGISHLWITVPEDEVNDVKSKLSHKSIKVYEETEKHFNNDYEGVTDYEDLLDEGYNELKPKYNKLENDTELKNLQKEINDLEDKNYQLEKFLSGDSTKENVKKALFDLIDMLDESEDEETDYTDYDASQPELFNTIQEDVSAAFAEVYGY